MVGGMLWPRLSTVGHSCTLSALPSHHTSAVEQPAGSVQPLATPRPALPRDRTYRAL